MEDKLEKTIAQLEKDFGVGTVMYANSKPKDIEGISTGSILLDRAIGIGGLPVGRVIEIYGPESSGKTTVCLHTIANTQKIGKKAAIIDMEHSLSTQYAQNLGVDLGSLLLSQPDNGEQALNVAKKLIETGEMGVIVIDSVAALVPKSEQEGDVGDPTVGKHARLMSQTLRILTPLAEKKGTTIIFTNQIREKIGVMFGNPETTTGGNALKFYASVRLEIRKKIDKVNQGNTTTIKVVKNKVAPPYQEVELFIKWGQGIDRRREIIELALEQNILTKSGAWYGYNGSNMAQGIDKLNLFLTDNPELQNEIESKLNLTI